MRHLRHLSLYLSVGFVGLFGVEGSDEFFFDVDFFVSVAVNVVFAEFAVVEDFFTVHCKAVSEEVAVSEFAVAAFHVWAVDGTLGHFRNTATFLIGCFCCSVEHSGHDLTLKFLYR